MGICRCGCGTEIAEGRTWVQGHNTKVGISRLEVPPSRVCDECGETYHRHDYYGMRNSDWLKRRFCSLPCRDAAIRSGKVFKRGSESPLWKPDAKVKDGNGRAQKLYPLDGKECEACGASAELRHHRDENSMNNVEGNIAFLCRSCHTAVHKLGRTRRRDVWSKRKRAYMLGLRADT